MADISFQPIRGFQDLLPPESEQAAALETVAREVFALYGFGEIRLPTLESEELFVKTTGETTDIVEKEMFKLEDQGGRKLALRPEGTPGVVRAFMDKHLRQQGPAAKLYYVGSMFRAERPQAGRFREFEQIGVEALGNAHPAADVEAILALKTIFDRAGLKGKTKLRLANLGCDEDPECRPRFRGRLRDFLKSREAELCPNCRRRMERNPLRALDCKGDGPRLAEAAPKLEPCARCRDHVDSVSRLLESSGCPHVYPDPTLVRGLDYYTRTVFEFSAQGIGSQDALAGGGRYDYLVGSMGGEPTPAVGWALGLERTLMAARLADPALSSLLGRRPQGRADVFVALAFKDEAAVAAAVRSLESLRQFGMRAAGGFFNLSLKAQMREAGRQGARFVAILGEEEFRRDPPSCMFKDMSTHEQKVVPISGVPELVGDLLLAHKD